MRTTLDIDDAVLRDAQACFPKGTPKTVIIEEALRLLATRGEVSEGRTTAAPMPHHTDPRWIRLLRSGVVTAATVSATSVQRRPTGLTLATLLDDLAADRADR